MTKSELIEKMVRKNNELPPKDIDSAVSLIMDQMVQSLQRNDRIEVRGFGSFSVTVRNPRVGRNPRTGESVKLDEKRVPHFKPGKLLKERINESRESVPLMEE